MNMDRNLLENAKGMFNRAPPNREDIDCEYWIFLPTYHPRIPRDTILPSYGASVTSRLSSFRWEEKGPLCQSDLESTWLFHEIGRCYLELEEYAKAKEYGDKSLASAQSSDDPIWRLNSTVLVGQTEGMW